MLKCPQCRTSWRHKGDKQMAYDPHLGEYKDPNEDPHFAAPGPLIRVHVDAETGSSIIEPQPGIPIGKFILPQDQQ
jgi:hypothetical protein